MTRILADYADQSKTCWASDSGKPVSECWCAQCNEGRTLYPIYVALETQIKEAELWQNRWSSVVADLHRANAKIDEARTYIERGIENGDITTAELDEPFWEDLFNLLGVEAKEEVEVYLDIRVLARVTKPRNEELSTYDFDLDTLEISANANGWEIEVDESEITDVTEQ